MSAVQPSRRRSLSVWGVALLVYVLAVFHRSSLSVAGLAATDRFEITASQLASFTMLQLLIYTVMQIPVGLLLDRFGPRRVLMSGIVVMTLAQVGFAFAGTYTAGLLARLFVGAGDALIFICVLRLVTTWFTPRQIPLMTQMTGFFGQLGAIVAAVPMTLALRELGWTGSYLIAASVGVVLGIALFLIVRDTPEAHVTSGPKITVREVARSLHGAWSEAGTRLGFWTHFTSQFSATVFALLWGYPFLVRGQDVSPTTAGVLLTLLTLFTMLAGPVVGWTVGNRPFHRSTLVLSIITAIVTVWTVVLVWPGPAPLPLLVLLMFVVGIGGPGAMVAFDFARTFNPPSRLGSATGIVNQGGFTASLLAVIAIGFALDVQPAAADGGYSAHSFTWAMSVQYVLWALGGVQIWRYRRRTRANLAAHDPEAFEALRAGRAGGSPTEVSAAP